MKDVAYALRVLARSPGFAAVAVLTLALGIGANTAIFSVVSRVLLAELPYRDPERLVVVWEHNYIRGNRQNVAAPADFLEWQAQSRSFTGLTARRGATFNFLGGEPEEVRGHLVESNYFEVLGAAAALGRTIVPSDGRPNAERVIVLSHRLWQRRFGADAALIGKSLALDGASYTVAGVMPPSFAPMGAAGFWIAGDFDRSVDYRAGFGRGIIVLGRLKPGVSLESAHAEMSGIAKRLEIQYPDFSKGWGVNIVPLYEQLTQDTKPALVMLTGAVAFLLLIACANVANLLLARAARRERELAIRASLGAGRSRLIRQLIIESVTLAVMGGTAGTAIAYWGVDALMRFAPASLESLGGVSIDPRVLWFTIGVSLLTGLLAGIAPAFTSTRFDLSSAMKDAGRGAAGSARGSFLRSAFVAAQVAMALILLTGAGLMIRSFSSLSAVNPGFRAEQILTARVSLPGSRYSEPHRRVTFFREAVDGIRRLPGVRKASGIVFLPFAGPGSATGFEIEGRPKPLPGQRPTCDVRIVLPGYFETMGIPLLAGRDFSERDNAQAPRTYIVSKAMADKHWPNSSPLGQRIVVRMEDRVPGEIVGVVADTLHAGLDSKAREMVYYAHPHLPAGLMSFVIRAAGDPESLATPVTGVIHSLDPDQPVSEIRTMESWIARSAAPMRFRMLLLMVFSALALVLAALGIYGVLAYAVEQRTREMGVRMALGADRLTILTMVFRYGAALSGIGLVIGAGGAFALTRLIRTLLFRVDPGDPGTFTVVSAIMLGVALAACLIPALRATRVSPIAALRYE